MDYRDWQNFVTKHHWQEGHIQAGIFGFNISVKPLVLQAAAERVKSRVCAGTTLWESDTPNLPAHSSFRSWGSLPAPQSTPAQSGEWGAALNTRSS